MNNKKITKITIGQMSWVMEQITTGKSVAWAAGALGMRTNTLYKALAKAKAQGFAAWRERDLRRSQG